MDKDVQNIYQAVKKEAAHFNDTQCEQEVVVGQPLEGDDAINFLQWLMNARRAVQGGQISAEEALQQASEWIVPE